MNQGPNSLLIGCCLTLALLNLPMSSEGQATATPHRIRPATLPRIATVDERYQSQNSEMAEVIGGNFWKSEPKLAA